MTLLVPFDGSELSKAALVRATEFGTVFDESVVAVSVVPIGNAEYARARDWIGPDEPFDEDAAVSTLHRQVADLCPSADFRHERVDRYATPGTIAKRVREVAAKVDASMVFVGSENAGRLVSTLSSVGDQLLTDQQYDVVIVRHRGPARIEELREASPHRRSKSDFYLPD